MAFLDFLLGRGEKTQQFQRFTPQQQSLQNQILGGGQQQLPQAFEYLNNILSGNPEAFAAFEAPSRRAFEEKTLPTIAERFSGLGAQKSSAFGQQVGQAGAALEENLAAQRGSMQQNALSQLMQLLGTGMTPSFDTAHTQAQPGFLQTGIQSLGQNLPLLALLKLMGGNSGTFS